MQRALIAGMITAVLAATLGVFIVLRRLSLVGDSLAHASLAGVAGGMLLGFYPFYGALLAAAGAALIIEFIRRAFPRYAEVALAVVMSGGMALAVIMISLKKVLTPISFHICSAAWWPYPQGMWRSLPVPAYLSLCP